MIVSIHVLNKLVDGNLHIVGSVEKLIVCIILEVAVIFRSLGFSSLTRSYIIEHSEDSSLSFIKKASFVSEICALPYQHV